MDRAPTGWRGFYRAAWWSIALPVALVGLATACLSLRLGALLLVGMVAGLIALIGSSLRATADATPPAMPSASVCLLGGVAALAGDGLILELGAAGWWIGVLIAAAGWPAFRRPRQDTVAHSQPPPPTVARSLTDSGAPAMEALPPEPLPELSALPSLSTPELCWAWRVSYLRVQRPTCASQLAHLSRLRGGYLDELQRRDPAAFDRWFPTARAASDPARFFCRQPHTPPEHRQVEPAPKTVRRAPVAPLSTGAPTEGESVPHTPGKARPQRA